MDVGEVEPRARLVRDRVRESRAGEAQRPLLRRIVVLIALYVVIHVGGILVFALWIHLHVMHGTIHEVIEVIAPVRPLDLVVVLVRVVCQISSFLNAPERTQFLR